MSAAQCPGRLQSPIIRRMAMFEFARNIRIKTFCNVLIVAMVAAGVVVGGASISTIREVIHVKHSWDAFDDGPGKKVSVLSDLRDAIGFGGFIHNFKNAILRKDKAMLERAKRREQAAMKAIADYRAVGTNAEEAAALATVEKMVRDYSAKTQVLEEMIDKDAPVSEIDRAVRVNDTSAAEALDVLDKNVKQETQAAEDKIHQAVSSAQQYTYLTLATVGILILSLIALFLWFAQSRLIRPIYGLMEFVNRVGNGDLTRQMADLSEDEVGTLCKRLNDMVANLKDITLQTRQAVNNLNSAAAETLASTKQQAASVAEQFAALQETTATVDEISQSGEQMSNRARDIAGQAEKASERSKDGLRSMDDLAKVMDAIEEQTEAVAEHIVALSEKTQAIGDIIATVNDIAERSQLLALNASIEAAAAGEHGRSFSVVAEEIKTLADQAKAATTQVSSILGDIQKGINSSVMSTEESVKRVANGRGQAENTLNTISDLAAIIEKSVQAFEQVVASTNQQRVGLEQVSQALQQIRTGSEQTAAGTKQIEQAVTNLNSLGSQLHHAMERYAV
jgi:methyl-accepting chemotaxis protein